MMKKHIVRTFMLACLNMSLLFAQQKPPIAILPFVGNGVSAATLELSTQFLSQELSASGAFDLIDINTAKSALSAAGYTAANCFDPACAGKVGQALGAEKVVLCRISKTGNQFRLEIKTVEAAAARETFSETVSVPSEDALFVKLADLTGRLTEALKQPVTAAPRAPEIKTAPPTPPPAPPASARPPLQIIHQPIPQATAGQPISVTAQVQPALGENELFLIYRPIGEERFRFALMRRVMNEEYFSEIPAEAIGTKGVEYYLRVIDRNSNEQGRFPQGNTYLSVTATAKIAEQPAPPPAKTQDKKKGGGKKWLLIGVGATAAGAGAYLIC
jgi:TolB-like protein